MQRSVWNAVTVLAVAVTVMLLAGCKCENCDNEIVVEPKPAPTHPAVRSNEPTTGNFTQFSETAPFAQSFGPGRLARIETAQVVRIGVRADSPPFGFVDKNDKDARPQGFDVELGFRIARALKVQPVYVTVTSQNRIEKLKNGEIDIIIATLTATRKRAKDIDFSIPYFQDQQSLLVPAASPIQSYRDLTGKKVATAVGSTSSDNLKVVAPDCQTVPVGTLTEGFEKLQKGEVDAVTGDGMTLRALDHNAPDPKAFRIAGEGFSVEPYAIGLPQNDSQFRARIDEILTEIWTTGAWTIIFDKWLGPKTPYNMEAHFQMPILPP
jgi:polar amino acid transport system substrate-binding protein